MKKHWESIPELQSRGKKAIEYLRSKDYKISALNIIYFEGLNPDLVTINNDRIDAWNDVRSVIGADGSVYLSCLATTEPGRHYTDNPLNPKGAARIKFGQYLESWCMGFHKSDRHPALVQCAPLQVYRDKNKDGFRTGDAIDTGHFGINQHTTSYARASIGYDSAGCLVGQYPETHCEKFLPMCRSMGLWRYDTTIIDGSDFAG